MQSVIRKGKLFKDIFYPKAQQRSYQLNRDLKSCVSLWQASQVFQKHKEQFITEQKTIFLQFLNNYPLSYNYRKLGSPISLYYQILSLQTNEMSQYEQLLKLSILVHLRQYVVREDKFSLSQQYQKLELYLSQNITKYPFDAVNAFNYLMLQKDSTNTQIFKHATEALKHSNYNILMAVMPKIIPGIIKRLSLNQWSTLRRFTHLLDFIAYQWKMQGIPQWNSFEIVSIISTWELHLIGYKAIPPCIIKMIRQTANKIRDKNPPHFSQLMLVFEMFDSLPPKCQQESFEIIKKHFFKKIQQGKQIVLIDKIPMKILSREEIEKIYDICMTRSNILTNVLFNGNNHKVRHWIKKTNCLNLLFEQHCRIKVPTAKNFSILITSAALLIEAYENDPKKIQQIIKVFKDAGQNIMRENQQQARKRKVISIMSILHLIHLNEKYKIGWKPHEFFEEFMRKQIEFYTTRKMVNILNSVRIYHKTESPILIQCISSLVKRSLNVTSRFYFKIFSQYIFLLAQYSHYKQTVDMLFNKLEDDDTPYFIELYNRFQYKSINLTLRIFQNVIQKNKSFKTLGKFLVIEKNEHLINQDGFILSNIAKALENAEQNLNIEQLMFFKPLEVVMILKFCQTHYNQVKKLSKKLNRLTLSYFQQTDFGKEGVKLTIKFIQACKELSLEEDQPLLNPVLQMISQAIQLFSSSTFLKVKQMELKWCLGLPQDNQVNSLFVKDILNILMQRGYTYSTEIIIILLKMSSFGGLQLPDSLIKKLSAIAIEDIKTKFSLNQVHTTISMLPNKVDQKIKGDYYISFLREVIKHIPKRSFYLLEPYIKAAEITLSKELVESILNSQYFISNAKQFQKIYHLIEPSLCLDLNQMFGKLARQAFSIHQRITKYLPDLIYQIHYHILNVKEQDLQIFGHIQKLAKQFVLQGNADKYKTNKYGNLFDLESQKKQLELRLEGAIKLLWVTIKKGDFSLKNDQLWNFILKNEIIIASMPQKTNIKNISWESIWETLEFYSKKYNSLKLKKETIQSFKNIFVNQSKKEIQKEDKRLISDKLNKLGLKKINQKDISPDRDNYYIFNFNVKELVPSLKVKQKGKQYGIYVIDELSQVTSTGKLMGKVLFKKTVYEAITELPIVPLRLKDAIKFD